MCPQICYIMPYEEPYSIRPKYEHSDVCDHPQKCFGLRPIRPLWAILFQEVKSIFHN